MQAPLIVRDREVPQDAVITLKAKGRPGEEDIAAIVKVLRVG